ncbi:MAG: DUF4860 domain-containing protein [Anaerovorax sp.]
MSGFRQTGGKYTSVFFVILLFFSLILCSLFTVLIGAQVYENINGRMEDNFRGQTALSYISNKVKQADSVGSVAVKIIDNTQVLVLEQVLGDAVYETKIYYRDGQIRELFSKKNAGLGLEAGIEILPSKGLTFTVVNDQLIEVKVADAWEERMLLSVRSEAGIHE